MAWSTQQLVRDASRQAMWAVPNAEHRPPRTFDDPEHGTFVPRWGTLALLKLAVQGRAVDLTPVRIVLRDVARMPLSPEVDEELNETLVDALRRGDLNRAQAVLQDGERAPYDVVEVHLVAEDGARLVVGRYGGFDITEDEPVDALLDAARSILSIS